MSVKQHKSDRPKMDKQMRQQIAIWLLEGLSEDEVIENVTAVGIGVAAAKLEVRKAIDSPYLQAGMRLGQRSLKRTWVLDSLSKLFRMRPEARGVLSAPADKLTPQAFYSEFYTRNTPLLIKGMAANWPAMNTWSLDYFEQTLGENDVEVQFGRSRSNRYELDKDVFKKTMPMGDFVKLLRKQETTNDYYLTAYNGDKNGKSLASLWDDTQPLDGYLTKVHGEGFFWMGPKGTLTPFHHDLTNNFLLQIVGRKRVVLAPAVEIARMRNVHHCFSDWANDPRAAAALPAEICPLMVECILEPGDMLFIPVGWWHFVEGLDMTFGMSFTNFVADNDFNSFYRTYGAV